MGLFNHAGGIQYLFVGLGNPGPKYEKTRHNAGFQALDQIADSCHTTIDRVKFKGLTAQVTLGGAKCLLLKPTTFMNLSGESVVAAMQFYKIPPERILVFFDDISLDPGKLRIRRKGTHGGHNGIRSIIEQLGRDDFPRVKLGVGKKPHPEYDLADWVLSTFTSDEQKQLQEVLKLAPEIATLFIQNQLDRAMNRFNT